MSKRRGHDFSEVRTNTGGDKSPSIREQVDLFKFPPDKFVTVRIISPVFMYAGYWVATKKKDGSPTKFYMPSPSYDPESQSFDTTVFDPFFEISKGEKGVERDARLIQIQKYGYCNAIILHEEARRPERIPRPTEQELATGFKEKDSDSWTPVKVLRLSSTMLEQIQGIAQTNIVTNKNTGETKAMSIAHPKFGMTIRIKHSPKKPAASQYQILPGERMPLSERQLKYLTWDLSDLERPEPEDRIRESYDRWAEKMGLADAGGGDDGFDDDQNPGRGRRPVKKAAVKKAARPAPQEESWDEGGDAEGWDEGGGDEGWDDSGGDSGYDDGSGEGWEDDGSGDAGWEDDGSGDAGWDDSGGDGSEEGGWDDGSGSEGDGAEDGEWDSGGGEDDAPWDDGSEGDDAGWEEPAPPRRPVKKAPRPQQQQRPVKKAARPPQQQQRPVKKAAKKAPRRPSEDDWG